MRKSYSDAFVYHLLGYVLILVIVGAFSDHLTALEDLSEFKRVFLLIALAGTGHLFAVVRSEITESAMLGLFLADIPITFVLVRATGASTSPFLVLYPLLSLSGSIGFRPIIGGGYLLAVLLFQVFSVGFGPAMIGNGLATITTSALGFYLVKALQKSDEALVVSEVQRKRLENLQRAILANIPSGLMSIDSQGRIIQINAVGNKILGTEESEVLYRPLKTLLPDLSQEVYKLSTQVPAINSLTHEHDRPSIRYKNPQGDELQLGFSIARLSDPGDKSIIGSLVVFQDLTEISRMEENLRMSEKLAAIGKLAAGIAHEIRNPLAGISGSAQMLSTAEGLGDEDKRLLSIIVRESARLDSLITEFLEYVRPAKGKMERVDLVRVCEHVIEGIKINSKWKGLQCKIDFVPKSSGTPIFALGDENKITQVLINLILNAGQAGAKNVRVLLSQHPTVIEVDDDGVGISLENQKRIFEPFFTTKDTGTGLGLATSYKALEAMEAKIEVVSPLSASGGTTFRVIFKAANS